MNFRQLRTLLELLLLLTVFVDRTLGRTCPPGTYWMRLLGTCDPCENICNPPSRPPCVQLCEDYVPPTKTPSASPKSVSWSSISPVLVPVVVGVILVSLIGSAIFMLIRRLHRMQPCIPQTAHLSVEESGHSDTQATNSTTNSSLLHGQNATDDEHDISDSLGSTEPLRV